MIVIYKDGNLLIQHSMNYPGTERMYTSPLPKPSFDRSRKSVLIPLSPDFMMHDTELNRSNSVRKEGISIVPGVNSIGISVMELSYTALKIHFVNDEGKFSRICTYPYFNKFNPSEFAFTTNINIESELQILMASNSSFDKLCQWVYTTGSHVDMYKVIVKDIQLQLIRANIDNIGISKPEGIDFTLLDYYHDIVLETGETNKEALLEEIQQHLIRSVENKVKDMLDIVTWKPVELNIQF
nr:MAG TPA: hypothetical protein [Caudoviricetes sp.]